MAEGPPAASPTTASAQVRPPPTAQPTTATAQAQDQPLSPTSTASASAQPLPAVPLAQASGGGGLSTPMVSGLPFRSGASFDVDCIAQIRGRPLDVNLSFLGHKSFPALVSYAASVGRAAKRAPLWVVTVPLLADNTKGQFAQCAAGAFDGYFRQIGANLRKAGAQGTIARLGHEANSGTHAWGVTSAGQIPAYKACFRRAAQALRAGSGGAVKIEWTNAKKGRVPALQMYPGDDVVDVWGVHYYDTGPQKSTQAIWNQYQDATYRGSPWGIHAWLKAAQAHGKKLGVGEWGVWNQGQGAAKADDPVYMDNMYRFFRDHAGDIAYETYLNANPRDGGHALCPSTRFPKAAARYKANWGR
jgi:hypothetical protein